MRVSPGQLNLALLHNFYRRSFHIELDRESRQQVDQAAETVRKAAMGDAAVYGVNTGFGKLANTRIPPEQTAQLQRNLILSHCCGVGVALPPAIVKMIMLLKLNSLGRGASGVRWQVIELLESMLNAGILPIIPAKGSVGASGDLAPLAHMTVALIGEGQVHYKGETVDVSDAMEEQGFSPIQLGPKEGLAMINGTQVSTAICLAGMFDAWACCQAALVTGALSSDALMASTAPFRQEIHILRGQLGQIDCANSLRSLLQGSEIRESHRDDDERVQDPYCLRCQPQVMGACVDLLRQVSHTLEIESNAVTDNPLVVNDHEILSGGNFHAEPVAFAADQVALAIAEMGSITERRIATLVDPALNYGMPAFLSPQPGVNSGFMVAEVTAAALMSENKQKATPCSTDSTPTSANQEDHVSMACHGAYRLLDMNENLSAIIAIELLTSSQGVEFRSPLVTSQPLQDAISILRSEVDFLGNDRFLAPDIEAATQMIRSGAVLESIDSELLPELVLNFRN